MKRELDTSKNMMDCKNIQPLLFDYMNRELGEGRSDLIRKHLKKCRECQVEAADIQATLDLLASAKSDTLPDHLSEEHRRRITWSITHPLLDWMHAHHILVSLIITVLVLFSIAAWTSREKTCPKEDVFSIYIGPLPATNQTSAPSDPP